MHGKRDIKGVRSELRSYIGRRIQVRTNLGRNRVDIMEGILAELYPSIFTIRVCANGDVPEHRISYSYNDVIAHDIELVF